MFIFWNAYSLDQALSDDINTEALGKVFHLHNLVVHLLVHFKYNSNVQTSSQSFLDLPLNLMALCSKLRALSGLLLDSNSHLAADSHSSETFDRSLKHFQATMT